jgi:glycerol-3-phosphate acyltransferase PlsY
MWWQFAVFALFGYVVGSVPVGLIVGQVARGIDIRQYGSGKIGFTNVLRTCGARWGLVALVGDLAKGVLPVLIARFVSDEPYVQALAGLAAAIGHDWPVFAGFEGGRGVATSYGAALVMNPIAAAVLLPLGIGLVVVTRIVSVMSVGMAPILAVEYVVLSAIGEQPWAFAVFAVIAAAMVIASHRENIQRLIAGTEPKIGQGGTSRAAGPRVDTR